MAKKPDPGSKPASDYQYMDKPWSKINLQVDPITWNPAETHSKSEYIDEKTFTKKYHGRIFVDQLYTPAYPADIRKWDCSACERKGWDVAFLPAPVGLDPLTFFSCGSGGTTNPCSYCRSDDFTADPNKGFPVPGYMSFVFTPTYACTKDKNIVSFYVAESGAATLIDENYASSTIDGVKNSPDCTRNASGTVNWLNASMNTEYTNAALSENIMHVYVAIDPDYSKCSKQK